MSRKLLGIPALILLLITLIFTGKPVPVSAEENLSISQGVSIDEVKVGGMTEEEAKSAVGAYIDGLKAKEVAVTVGKNVAYSTMGDLGYSADTKDVIKKAIDLGKTGNLIKRYKDLKDVEQGNMVLPLTFTYDKNKITDLVSKKVSAYNVEPVNATVSIKNGKLAYTDPVKGSKVNIVETAKLIENTFDKWDRQDIVVNAVADEEMPAYSREFVEKCNTLIGSFTTDYSSSAWGRATNLANGARLINNTVLYPGDTFSAYDHLAPFTHKNGYQVAGAYLKGKVIDSVGGGACQVTTTLYNAVLNAELEVTERYPHSMTISYVDLSRDAAIANTSKNLEFKNSTEAPVLIQAYTYNRKITFKIWGQETRDTKKRKIEYVTEVISKRNPPADVITKDPSMPSTYRKVTSAAHIGYQAKLYKLIYENGVKVDKILINTSYYQASPRCVTVGTKIEKEDKDTSKEEDLKKDKNSGTQDKNDSKKSNKTDNKKNSDGQMQSEIWDPSQDLE